MKRTRSSTRPSADSNPPGSDAANELRGPARQERAFELALEWLSAASLVQAECVSKALHRAGEAAAKSQALALVAFYQDLGDLELNATVATEVSPTTRFPNQISSTGSNDVCSAIGRGRAATFLCERWAPLF